MLIAQAGGGNLAASLPSRERGLKSVASDKRERENQSLPSRERGLKLSISDTNIVFHNVAPLAGAWVEIRYSSAIFA